MESERGVVGVLSLYSPTESLTAYGIGDDARICRRYESNSIYWICFIVVLFESVSSFADILPKSHSAPIYGHIISRLYICLTPLITRLDRRHRIHDILKYPNYLLQKLSKAVVDSPSLSSALMFRDQEICIHNKEIPKPPKRTALPVSIKAHNVHFKTPFSQTLIQIPMKGKTHPFGEIVSV